MHLNLAAKWFKKQDHLSPLFRISDISMVAPPYSNALKCAVTDASNAARS